MSGVEVRPLSRLPATRLALPPSGVRPAPVRPSPYTSRRCRPPSRPDRTPPSCSRSNSPPSASAAPSTPPSVPCRAGRGSRDSARARRRDRSWSAISARASSSTRPSSTWSSDAYREAILEQDIIPLTNPEVEIVQADEGEPLVFKATVQVRPEVDLGDYKHFNFSPEIETIDDARVSTRSSTSCATRTRPSPRSRTAARRMATTRSSRSSGRATASHSKAAAPSGCRSSSARSA